MLLKHVIGLCETGEQVIDSISLSFPEDSPFSNQSANVAHKTLATKDKEEIETVASSLNTKISELKSTFATLRVAIADREVIRSQMDYYKEKVAGLHAERDKVKEKGGEQQKQMDRRLRNEANLNRLTHQYELKNKELKHELYTLEAVRLNVLAYLYMDIVTLEYMLARALVNATSPERPQLQTTPIFTPSSTSSSSSSSLSTQPSQDQHQYQHHNQQEEQTTVDYTMPTDFGSDINQEHSVTSSPLPSSSSFSTPDSLLFQQLQLSSNDASVPTGSTESAKKRPPPFIRSRVASGTSSSSTSITPTTSIGSVSDRTPEFSVPENKRKDSNSGIVRPAGDTFTSELGAPGSVYPNNSSLNDQPPPMPKSLPPNLRL